PLLHHALGDAVGGLPDEARDALLSANLTGLVRHGSTVDVAIEAVGMCRALAVKVTLLKGISTAGQRRPRAHWRPVRAVDILVADEDRNRIERALVDCGYLAALHPGTTDASRHGAPLRHPGSDVWVEVHSALFPPYVALTANGLF